MKVRVTFEAEFVNFNPPRVYNPTPKEVRDQLDAMLQANSDTVLWLDTERKTGVFQRDLFTNPKIHVTVDARPQTYTILRSLLHRLLGSRYHQQ